jgi:hypothetical protein
MANPQLVAYSLETVVAEKFQTMIDKGVFNSRMKDFFDLYRIIIAHKFNEDDLMAAIVATFNNRILISRLITSFLPRTLPRMPCLINAGMHSAPNLKLCLHRPLQRL